MNTPPRNVIESINSARSVVITTHRNPDGDAVGSALGFWHMLRSMGKQAHVILPNEEPQNLRWLPGAREMTVFGEDCSHRVANADTIVVLDLNALSRLEKLAEAITSSGATIVNIDHHTHPENFAHVQWIDIEACSTAMMVAQIAMQCNVITAPLATCLYTGIMTDTGSFRFPRTTPEVFEIAGLLVANGADPVMAYDEVMNRGSIQRTQLLGKCLSQLQIHASGALCTMVVSRADLEHYQCTTEDTEGFVSQTLALDGVQMGILFVELADEVKISFRSKNSIYVRDLAAKFGGGGHVYAAGARIKGQPLQQVVATVTERAITSIGS